MKMGVGVAGRERNVTGVSNPRESLHPAAQRHNEL